jgi:FAD-dependent halogenase
MKSYDVEEFDLIVIGGGPAGSTLSTFVSMQNHKVLLIERELFPRYQIGESLLPATVHGICVMLGIAEDLKEANFTKKLGGTFRWGKNAAPWTFNFGSSLKMEGPTAYAYQVERSKFDAILLNNAKRKGVDVRQRCSFNSALIEDGRIVGVRYTDEESRERIATARFVADASGHQSRLAEKVGERIYSKFFQNVALFCYYNNGKRLPPPNQGNILSAAFEDGWFWYIPLSETLTSLGIVLRREQADKLRQGYEVAMRACIEKCPIIKEYLASATRVTEGIYGQFRVRKDYSYANSRFWAPGAVLVGDAACFVDPVFSSGVHLATYSALLAARSINTCLGGALDEERCFDEFEGRYRREYGNFYQFVLAFYDMHKDEDSYFWEARKVLNTEERANEAFVRLVAGVSTSGEQLYSSSEEFFQSREGIGEGLFEWYAERDRRLVVPSPDAKKFNTGTFLDGLTKESVQIQVQARARGSQALEGPILPGGLVTSTDGFHWREPSLSSH